MLSLSFDRILASPFERACQTAQIVAQALRLDRSEEIEQLAPDHSAEDLVSALAVYSSQKKILVIGHEPLLSRTLAFLLAGKSGAKIRLKKGGLCCLEVDSLPPKDSAVPEWAWAPKHLGLLA